MKRQIALSCMAGICMLPITATATPTCSGIGQCVAPSGGESPATRHTENRAYLGLEWGLGGKLVLAPQVVLGFRSVAIKGNGDVSGGDFGLKFNVLHGITPDSVRLVYVGGGQDVQGNVGGGYSYTQNSWIATGGIQGAYSRVGVDYAYGSGAFLPFIQLNTFQKPVKNNGSSGPLTCPKYHALRNSTTYGAPASQSKDGMTCVRMA